MMRTGCNFDRPIPPAPTLILDLLVGGGRAMTAEAICRAGALMGVADATMRVSLTRLKAAGKVHCHARGLYRITPAAHPLREAVIQLHRKRMQCRPWILGDWIAIHDAAVSKADRTAYRHHLLALALLGFSELRAGLHVRPDNFVGGVKGAAESAQGSGLGRPGLWLQIEPARGWLRSTGPGAVGCRSADPHRSTVFGGARDARRRVRPYPARRRGARIAAPGADGHRASGSRSVAPATTDGGRRSRTLAFGDDVASSPGAQPLAGVAGARQACSRCRLGSAGGPKQPLIRCRR